MTLDTRRSLRGIALTYVLVLVGSLLCQAAWALVVPPFKGLDEHDHAYKAAAVAHGDWAAHHQASSQGRGELVRVPPSLVAAAKPVCELFPDATRDNCTPQVAGPDGLSPVASSAARYNPVFYFLIGTPTLGLKGYGALYGMRGAAGLLCAVLVALAATVTMLWSRTRWPAASLLLVATPTFSYSTAVAAPNGIEMAGAMLVWSSLLGLVRGDGAGHRLFIATTTVGALPLVTVRALGPLWMALIVAVVLMLLPKGAWKPILQDPLTKACATLVGLAAASAAAWTWWAGTNSPATGVGNFGNPSAWDFFTSWVLWFYQAVAAFPARNEVAPMSIYAVVFLAWWILVSLAMRFASGRERAAALMVLALGSAVPIAVMAGTYSSLGSLWQGRYGYPLCMGLVLICGLALDRSPLLGNFRAWPLWLAGAATLAAQLISQLHVLETQSRRSPLADTSAWLQPPSVVVVALTALGVVTWTAGSERRRRPRPSTTRPGA